MKRRLAAITLITAVGCSSSSSPPNVNPLVREGWRSYENGDFESASGRFSEAVAADPGSAPAYSGLGLTLARLRRFPDAAASFLSAIDSDPDLTDAYAGLAIVDAARNDYEAVVAPATLLISMAPTYVHPHDSEVNVRVVRLVRAQAYFHAGDYQRAARDLDILDPDAAPHSPDPQSLLAALARLSGLGFTP